MRKIATEAAVVVESSVRKTVAPQPLSAPAGLLKREHVRISEQETFRMNEELLRRRRADIAGKPLVEEEVTQDQALPSHDFDLEKMLESWNEFVSKLRADDRLSLAATLSAEAPTLENTTIHFRVSNDLQLRDIDGLRMEMLEFLRRKLQNYTVDLNVILDQEATIKLKLLTDKDKYEKLLEKHPSLEKLRQALNLDIRM
ncbi:MAG: hypothetical protein GC193_11530 [Cryomorphaceae bacterium]|nr:hypothetical protein [Cryomorphaceae bacterium]